MSRKKPHHGSTNRGNPHGTRGKQRDQLTGTIHVSRPGYATVDTAEGTFVVARGGIHEAMNGDEVQVSLEHRGGSEPMAVVRSVAHRATLTFLGTYEPAGPLGAVTPLDNRMVHDFFVLPDDNSAQRLGVGEGDVVEARVLEYPAKGSAGVVTLDRRVGAAAKLDLLMETVIASHGLATYFNPAALSQASELSLDVEGALAAQRLRQDLRDLVTFTIDPTDARDFDDAVNARRLEDGGYEVGVHIADVTSYLPWDSPMDLEARQRICSVYLADRVLPMLPERLCNDLCSLRPHEDRLTMTVMLTLDQSAKVLKAKAMPSVIHSHARLDYDTADALLKGHINEEDLPCEPVDALPVAKAIRLLDEVAQKRVKLRRARGAVDFETREARVILDEDGHPEGVSVREKTHATSLIEEAMLMANEAVAKMLADIDAPAAYRVHERPAPEHLSETLPVLHELRLLEPGDAERLVAGDPYVVQEVLGRAKDTSGEVLTNALLLRAQKRAVYKPHNEGHYALGASAYCHFTSPIRRYPDDVVHRALKAQLYGSLGSKEQAQINESLPQICLTCSEQERVADKASIESQKIKMAELFERYIGECFSGVVVGCERYGLFVMLDETCAEGLLPTRALGSEWFTYDDTRMALVGEESGKTYRLGQRVAVEVTGTNRAKGQIDFALAGSRA
ncbi:MAG: VacB/RNase II family 3'-5' exoribonuclease [Atopobiaceae bacterium]|nr:VacB/RNase II family 3'-5' exoribonuclease [Atopobiaceae bacterium]